MLRRTLAVVAAALIAATGCSDQSAAPLAPEREAPEQAVESLLSTESVSTNGLLQFVALPDLTENRHAEKWIRADEGGFVELNGFRVDIPAGALPHDALVTIDLPQDELLGKHVIAEFGPHGIQFNTPVTLTFPLDGVIVPEGQLTVGRWEGSAWNYLGGMVSADGSSLSGTTPHFSAYGAHVMAGG